MLDQLLNNYQPLLLLILLWTMPWKGVALWKAAKKNDQLWFIAILLLNTLAILDILYLYFFSERQRKT